MAGNKAKSSVDRKKSQASSPANTEKGNLDQIRDILFGDKARQYDTQFLQLKAQIAEEMKQLRREMGEHVAAIKKMLAETNADMTERLDVEKKERIQSQSELADMLKETQKSLQSRIDQGEQEIRAMMESQLTSLRNDMDNQHQNAVASTKRMIANLKSQKANSNDLSSLFAEISTRLSGTEKETVASNTTEKNRNRPMPPDNVQLPDAVQPDLGSNASETSFIRLRSLLLGATEAQIKTLHTRLKNPDLRIQELSQDLPAALIQRAQKDNQLTQALLKTVEGIVQTSVERDPHPMVNAIYPAIAPALRRAVSQSIRQMVSSMNQTLNNSLSFKGLKWRVEAWRTGRSYAEVVMLNSLLFRVEQLFLIERETGLLLRHVTADGAKGEDPDIVSGMLTAIRDFAHDSFRLDKEESLAAVEIGDREIFMVQGPKAVLAVLVWGTPPETFRETLNETLEEIHLTCAGEFKENEADPSAFEKVTPVLQRALLVEERPDTQRVSMMTWLLLLGLVVLIGYGGNIWWTRSETWSDFQSMLDQEPGIVLTNAERNWSGYSIRGLRDPLAKDPIQIARDAGLNPEKMSSQWEPYQALTPPMIITRAQKITAAPETVQFAFDKGLLKLSGNASADWGAKAKAMLVHMAGVEQLDDSKLTLYTSLELLLEKARSLMALPQSVTLGISGDRIAIQGEMPLEWFQRYHQQFQNRFAPHTLDTTHLTFSEQQELQEKIATLAGEKLYFAEESAELVPGYGPDTIRLLVESITQLSELADLLVQPIKIEIKGKTDIRGSTKYNLALSKRRAETIRNLLIEKGVPADILIAKGQSVEEFLDLKRRGFLDENDRRVEFVVNNQ